MNIWWCEEHKASALDRDVCLYEAERGADRHRCHLVQMQLVPIPTPAPYEIEIPDFVNRIGIW